MKNDETPSSKENRDIPECVENVNVKIFAPDVVCCDIKLCCFLCVKLDPIG